MVTDAEGQPAVDRPDPCLQRGVVEPVRTLVGTVEPSPSVSDGVALQRTDGGAPGGLGIAARLEGLVGEDGFQQRQQLTLTGPDIHRSEQGVDEFDRLASQRRPAGRQPGQVDAGVEVGDDRRCPAGLDGIGGDLEHPVDEHPQRGVRVTAPLQQGGRPVADRWKHVEPAVNGEQQSVIEKATRPPANPTTPYRCRR